MAYVDQNTGKVYQGDLSPETTTNTKQQEKIANNMLIIYSISFLIVSGIGLFVLINKKSSIWFYLLLFFVIAPVFAALSGIIYASSASNKTN